ncbi:MAG: helix-turn-helix transcriptional regulator [Propionibacteriaceae bacterium]|nr:helix-turn-helix transcriptional regulator [Propionibacteriaceae bacterium]
MGKNEVSGVVTSPESLGRILQQSRLATRLTQRELAEQLGISQRYVWEMETGKPSLYTDRLFAYMRATGMRLTATIDIDEELFHG